MSKQIPNRKDFAKGLLAYGALVLLFSAAFFYRPFVDGAYFVEIASNPDVLGPGFFLRVLYWQALVWLPWVFLFTWLGHQFRSLRLRRGGKNLLGFHLVVSGVVAATNLLWFRVFSENFSPFIGFETTALGVFLWFHMFWFFLGFTVYWAAIGFLLIQRAEVFATAEEVAGKQTRALFEKLEPGSGRLVLKTGKKSIVLDLKDIIWIEAQEYYAVIHTQEDQHWVKISLGKLLQKLPGGAFARVHRATILNTAFLKEIKTDQSDAKVAVLKNGTTRKISRKGWADLEAVLKTKS